MIQTSRVLRAAKGSGSGLRPVAAHRDGTAGERAGS
jgi:hypothetical protein